MGPGMIFFESPTFTRAAKKLHLNQARDLARARKDISKNPEIGTLKTGDLSGVRVYKFKMVNQLTLLAYRVNNEELEFISFGSHENFYRDLKNYV